MTRLQEDRKLLDQILVKGIQTWKKGIDTNFSNFTDRLIDLYKVTGNRSYLEKYESLIIIKDGKKRHPAFMKDNPLIAFPIFIATKDFKYIREIDDYCKSAIEKKEYRTAEDIFLECLS